MSVVKEPLSPVSPFGVKLRSANAPRKERAHKAYSMSFLESSSKSNQQLLVTEFKDPFEATSERDSRTLPVSSNKWSTTVIPRRKDSNNNNSSGSQSNRSSCAFSDEAFYGGDDLNNISNDAKPILKFWASRSKQNVNKRNSEIGTSSTSPVTRRARERKERPASSYLEQGLNNTPWGKYFKPAKSASLPPRTAIVRPLSHVTSGHKSSEKTTEQLQNTQDLSSSCQISFTKTDACEKTDKKELDKKNIVNQHRPLSRTSPRLERLSKDNINQESTNSEVKTVRVEPFVHVESKESESLRTSKKVEDFNNNNKGIPHEPTQKESSYTGKKNEEETTKTKRKENKDSVKRLIRIKSLDLRDLRFSRKNSNKDEDIKSPSPQTKSPDTSRERKNSSKQQKQESKQGSGKKKRSKRKKSASLLTEYVRVDFLQQPQKINQIISEDASNDTSEKGLDSTIELSDKANLNNYNTTKHVDKSREIVIETKRTGIDNSLIDDSTSRVHYDKKERIERPKSLSLRSCEIDIDADLDNTKPQTDNYTDILNQITGIWGTDQTQLSTDDTRRLNFESTQKRDLNNISFARRKSEPVVKTSQQKQKDHVEEQNELLDNQTISVFNSKSENNLNEDIIKDNNNIDMSSSYRSRYSTPGSYYNGQNTTLNSIIDKSTNHSGYGLESYISGDKYSRRSINEFLTKNSLTDKYNGSATENHRSKIRAISEPESYTKVTVQEKTISSKEKFYPKSAYLRQRLQELGELESSSPQTVSSQGSRKLVTRLKRSATTSDDKYDPSEVDAFIKTYKERQLNYSKSSAPSSGYSSLSSSDRSSLIDNLTFDRTSVVNPSSTLQDDLEITCSERKSRSSSQSSTGSSKVENSVFKKFERSQSRDSRSSSVSDNEEMERLFRRNSSGRNSGNKFTRNEPKRFSERGKDRLQRNEQISTSDKNTDSKSPFLRSLSTRSSARSSNSDSPVASPTSVTSFNSVFTSEGTRSPSPVVSSSKFSTPSLFSIKKIHSAKISNVEELKSTAKKKDSRKTKDNEISSVAKQPETTVEEQAVLVNDSHKTTSEEHEKHGFSFFNKKKHGDVASPPSPKQQHQRKHSLSNIFSLKKHNKDKDVTPPGSPKHKLDKRRGSAPILTPSLVTVPSKERRGSSFMKLFHKKSHHSSNGDITKDSIDNIQETQNESDELIKTEEINNSTDSQQTTEVTTIKSNEKDIKPADETQQDETVKKSVSTTVKVTARRTQSEFIPSINIEESKNRSLSVGQTVKTKGLSITVNGVKKKVVDDKDFLVRSGQDDGFVHVEETESNAPSSKPDIMSSTDNINEDETADVSSPIQEKRNQRRDRRIQGLNSEDLNAALGLPPKTDEKLENNLLSVSSTNGDMGSSESLYDSDCGTKRSSRNKERIRSRKAARKEAQERHKSLPAGLGDIDITQISADIDNKENKVQQNTETETQTPKTRKKHRARRANTEFIVNVPNINIDPSSPLLSRDDGIVMRRNNKRNIRRDRPRTLTAGVDSELIFGLEKDIDDGIDEKSGVVQENISFADIKKKLLEGLTDDKKIPEKVPQKERQKIKRTKSSKRYKTITEGIAPRDLELARQAMEAQTGGNGGNTIDTDTLAQITAALTSTSDKRKSVIVENRPGSRYQSQENLNLSDPELNKTKENKTDDIPRPAPLHRTKSMTTMHLQLDQHEPDEDEPEIKPLSELKNRFLQAMEDTKQKHLTKKTPVEIKRRTKGRSRQDRPHTICGLDNFTMEQLQNEIGNAPDSEFKKQEEHRQSEKQDEIKQEIEKQKEIDEEQNRINKTKVTKAASLPSGPIEQKKREKKRYNRADSQKIFDDLFDDIDDILDDGFSESDLASIIGCNPSLHQDAPHVDLQITGNKKEEKQAEEKEEDKTEQVQNEPITSNEPQQPLSDLDFVSNQSTQLSSSLASDKRSIRPSRRQRTGVNPVKSLQKRDDLIDETEIESKTKEEKKSAHPVVEAYRGLKQTAENKNQNPVERLLNRDLADEAVSALRATVDFSKTKLKKVEVGQKADVFAENFIPTEVTNLLLQVKGRKKVQSTVVDFNAESLNSNDCFIVITPKELVCWNGAQANVIERAKAAEIASRINQKKEMGCKSFDVLYLDQGSNDAKVMRMLGSSSTKINTSRAAVFDEDFEKTMTSAYMTYEVCNAGDEPELIPFDAQCHRMPSKDILLTDTAFVFDFISEVYVWLGRQTSSQQRKVIQELAANKFDEGYFQLKLEASPTHLPQLGNSRRISVTASTSQHRSKDKKRRVSIQQGRHQKREMVPRPPHSLLLQLFEGAEWVIFKEKFCDWPDESRIIRMKGGPGSVGEVTKEVSTQVNIAPVDPTTMVEHPPMYKMVLDNLDIGRGRGVPKGMDGYHIITIDVKTWHVSENNSLLMPDASFAQFHSGEGYVIRWQYRVVKVRALRNCDDVMKAGGMERCCYFFWLGNDCSVNEEGATAVMTIELDSEKGPQIRVLLGKEPPALLNLFDGCMVIHAGKRPAPGVRTQYSDQSVIRLYCVRNEEANEACLLQVPAMCESLRSRGSFLLLLCTNGEVFLWHGCNSNEGTRKAAEHAVQMLMQNHPDEAGIGDKTELGFHEFEEGEEPEVFWIALGGQEDYGSLLDNESELSTFSPRLFHLDPTTDVFIAHEIVSPSRTPVFNCPFPMLQDDMYNVEQPAIFLVDAVTHVWLWFGWWPDEAETEASMSRRRRWGEERRKAMESAVAYANEIGRDLQTMYCVHAGLEPESFIELFPYWVIQEDITDLQLDEGIEENKLYKITEELTMFSKEFYTIAELREKPPPQGVDPTKLEKYLSEEEFLEVFKFHKPTFYKLPIWQQTNWKKKVDLY